MSIHLSIQEINPCMRAAGIEDQSAYIGPSRIIYDYEMIYCHKGHINVIYEDRIIEAGEGDTIIISPGHPHQLNYHKAKEIYWIHFDFYFHDDQADLARYIDTNKSKALSVKSHRPSYIRSSVIIKPNRTLPEQYKTYNPDATKNTYLALIEQFKTKPFGWSLVCKRLILSLLETTFSYLQTSTKAFSDQSLLADSIKDYLKEHSHRRIHSDELANHFHYHIDTLNRHFKKNTGMTIRQYSRSLRIQKVKSLLRDTSLSLDSIAEQCGYTDRSHLIAEFKSTEKMTPTEYRQNKGPT